MICIEDWKTKDTLSLKEYLSNKKYEKAFLSIGECDDRLDFVSQLLSDVSDEVIDVEYDSEQAAIKIGNDMFRLGDPEQSPIVGTRLLIDATSIELPELVRLFKHLDEQKQAFDVLYIQPSQYNEGSSKSLYDQTSYDLSDDGLGIQQIPPFVGFTDNSVTCIFLGFEGHRVGALINSDEFRPKEAACLIGNPPFKIGWESASLSSNLRQITELSHDVGAQFRFVGANDPLQTYEALKLLHKQAKYEQKRFCLVPFGTKPSTIAAAQFAVNHRGVILTYDFIRKKRRRTKGVGTCHIWKFIPM